MTWQFKHRNQTSSFFTKIAFRRNMSRYPQNISFDFDKAPKIISWQCVEIYRVLWYLKFLNEYNGIQSKVNYTNVTVNYSYSVVESSQLLTIL